MAAVGVFCASSDTLDEKWLDLARSTGREIAARGHRLVTGGGRSGMMGAVAIAAREGGAHTLGVINQALVDLEVADVDSDELIIVADMGARKNLLIERSDAFIVLPGGIGTLDELFEVWTTGSLDLHAKPIVLLDPDGFYDGLLTWLDDLTDQAFVRPYARSRVVVAKTVEAALDLISSTV